MSRKHGRKKHEKAGNIKMDKIRSELKAGA